MRRVCVCVCVTVCVCVCVDCWFPEVQLGAALLHDSSLIDPLLDEVDDNGALARVRHGTPRPSTVHCVRCVSSGLQHAFVDHVAAAHAAQAMRVIRRVMSSGLSSSCTRTGP